MHKNPKLYHREEVEMVEKILHNNSGTAINFNEIFDVAKI